MSYCNGKKYTLHRLIAIAFKLPRTEEQTQVNHKDGNPANPRLDNLEWVTPRENIIHSYKTNKNRASCALRKSKPLSARKIGTEEWVDFPSAHEASRLLGETGEPTRFDRSVFSNGQPRRGSSTLRQDPPTAPTQPPTLVGTCRPSQKWVFGMRTCTHTPPRNGMHSIPNLCFHKAATAKKSGVGNWVPKPRSMQRARARIVGPGRTGVRTNTRRRLSPSLSLSLSAGNTSVPTKRQGFHSGSVQAH
jgi:hypothetical protein